MLPSDLLLGRFYDLNGDGCITRQEMLVIVSAIYEMVQNAQTIQFVVNKQVDRFFEKMDADRDGIVSREDFMSGCKNVRMRNIPPCRKNNVIRILTLEGFHLATIKPFIEYIQIFLQQKSYKSHH